MPGAVLQKRSTYSSAIRSRRGQDRGEQKRRLRVQFRFRGGNVSTDRREISTRRYRADLHFVANAMHMVIYGHCR
jgi:hypothetical protein